MKKLLVIRLGALGDLLHMSPSLDAVKAARPETEIHVLSGPLYEPLLRLMPSVDHIWIWDKRAGWPGLFRLAGQLRAIGIEGVVNLHPSFKSWLFTQLLQPVRQDIYHKQKLGIKGATQRALSRRHAVADFYEPFRRLLNLPAADRLIPRLVLSGAASVKPSGERWIGLIPGVGAKRGNRAWEPAAYQRLIAALLVEPAVRVVLIGGPEEHALAEQLVQSAGAYQDRVENHCGRHDIPGTALLLTQCDAVMGGDTGPMHLAAAMGVPLVAIYGPTSLARTGPVGEQPIQSLTPPEALACWPCELATCPYTGDDHLRCMQDIPVEAVLSALQHLAKP